MYPCPCCGHKVFDRESGSYEVYPICYWEDDIVRLAFPDCTGDANRCSQIESQINYAMLGACEERLKDSFGFPPEVKQLMDQNLATGMHGSEDDALQVALHALSDYDATIVDIRQGMSDYEQGRGEPLSRAMADIRQQLGSTRCSSLSAR